MRVAICAFVMLEVLATASSMNTEGRQLRMVNRLTEADPKPKSDDVIGDPNLTNAIIKKGETVAKPEVKIAGTRVDKVAVKPTALKGTAPKGTAAKGTTAKGTAAIVTSKLVFKIGPQRGKTPNTVSKVGVQMTVKEKKPTAPKPAVSEATAPENKVP